MTKRQKISFMGIMRLFPDDATAEKWYIKHRWPDGARCVHCDSRNVAEINTIRPYRMWRCRPCNRTFSAKTKSLMHSSNLGFRIWVLAIYQVTTNLKGIASTKLASDLGIKQSSAWHMIHRIRSAYPNGTLLTGPVEVDEMFIGGVDWNRHASQKDDRQKSYWSKTAVVGIKSRADKKVHAKAVDTVSAMTLQRTVRSNVEPGAMVYTDQHRGYRGLTRHGFNHAAVNHKAKQYVAGSCHTSGIESFWAMFKRGYIGTFHSLSKKHVQRYVDEFVGRHNVRSLDTLTQMGTLANGFHGKTLRYRDLVG